MSHADAPAAVRQRVLVTRAAHQAGKLADALREAGFEPIEIPVLAIVPPPSFDALDAALARVHDFDWLILTSANGVASVVERAAALGVSQAVLGRLSVAAVGPATAEAARQAGLAVELTPTAYIAESLVQSLTAPAAGKRVLLARARVARDVIPDALRPLVAELVVADAYETIRPPTTAERLRTAVADGLHAATFTSSSSVNNLAAALLEAGLPCPLSGVAAISIGSITSSTLRSLGWPPAAEATPSDIPGLVAAVASYFANKN